MHIQRFLLTAIILPLAIAAPIANIANDNQSPQSTRVVDKYEESTSTSFTLQARQILWTILGPLGFEPVVDGLNAAIVGLGLK